MRGFFVAISLLSLTFSGYAQNRKLPDFTFEEKSLAFANTNVVYSQGRSYTDSDTLQDEKIVVVLAKILEENPALRIELGGHTAFNEKRSLGLERATLVKKMLVNQGIDEARLEIENYAHERPIISDDVLLQLPSAIEKSAANAKNRRVEVKVIADDHE